MGVAASNNIVSETIPSPSPSPLASESESTVNPLVGPFDVFLSFRGPDTRYGFSDYLYHELIDAGIRAFRDHEENRPREKMRTELITGIENSKIAIPVLSKSYAESKWCLRELAKIAECKEKKGQVVIPVFYHITPLEVKNCAKGCYKNFFSIHEKDKNVTKTDLKEWKDAFAIFGGLDKPVAFELTKFAYERECIKEIVKCVLSKLKIKNVDEADNLVGMDSHVRKFQALLDETDSNDVRVIGIHGMSGIGKTTIAKFIYNKLNNLFNSNHCFLEDVAGKSKHDDDLISLQKQLVSDIRNREKPDIRNVHQGANQIKEAISKRKVFVILDNVDSESQIKNLLTGGRNALKEICGPGSLFIITTTHENILRASEVTRTYEPKLMGRSDALKLFCQHAFKKDCPPNDFDSLIEKVVTSARGLPLVLVILGSLLSVEKDKGSWVSISNKLIETPHSKVLERLRIGYDALDYSQRQIFLDIACFFVGVHKDAPVYMWEDCGFHPLEGIETLVRRSLITVGKGDNIIRMHDQLIQLGRQIVKEKAAEPYLQKVPRKRSRLWDHHEALETLTRYQGAEKVEALNLNLKAVKKDEYEQLLLGGQGCVQIEFVQRFGNQEIKQVHYIRRLLEKDFSHLPNLRFLRLGYVSLYGDFKHRFSNLRWLEWRCSEKCIPINFYPKNLVVLDLSNSEITGEWEKYWKSFKDAKKLKVLNLSGCKSLRSAPDFITTLEILNLSRTLVEQINPWLCKLTALRALDLSYCKIKNIDCSTLANLEILNLSSTHLEQISPWLSKLTALRALDLSYCDIKNLDCSTLANLEILNLLSCKSLSEITGLEKSVSLTNLKTSYCERLTTLGDLLKLKSLKELEIENCTLFTEIVGLEELESLELLNMKLCKGVKELPDLSKLTKLKTMLLSDCEELDKIGGLRGLVSMEYLDLRNCQSIVRSPVVSNTRMLRKLMLINCRKLSVIEGLGDLGSLEVLDMYGCISISRLPDLSNARMLKELCLYSCTKLTEVGDLGGLDSLEYLDVIYCPSIVRLPKFSNPIKLKKLFVDGCLMLREIEGFSDLVSLETLDITDCNSLENTLDFSNLKRLKVLRASNLKHWTEITGLEECKSLQNLDVGGCILLEKLPDFSNFENMQKLFARNCKKLAQIQGLEDLNKRHCKTNVDGQVTTLVIAC